MCRCAYHVLVAMENFAGLCVNGSKNQRKVILKQILPSLYKSDGLNLTGLSLNGNYSALTRRHAVLTVLLFRYFDCAFY